MLPIFIATLGRQRLITLEQFPTELLRKTVLVTNRAQFKDLAHQYPDTTVVHCPYQPEPGEKVDGSAKGLSPVRQWIADHFRGKVIIADDDLTFQVRLEPMVPFKTRPAEVFDMVRLIEDMSELSKRYAMVGLAHRSGSNRITERLVHAHRMHNIWSVDLTLMNRLGIRFDAVPTMQDFWVHLGFLSEGYNTAMICNRLYNPAASNAAGGCSLYRTNVTQRISVGRIVQRFPEFTKLVTKETKGGWFGNEPRIDVHVQWKKALQHGLDKRQNDDIL